MNGSKPYVLFCAGEDSGDCLGEPLVRTLKSFEQDGSFDAVGAGGYRMQLQGLASLVDFEELPVSGFGDVLFKYPRLRKNYRVLLNALKSPLCKGLVAIDYPGFNMKLVETAKSLKKKVLYVAPPQIWAWKPHRAKRFAQSPFVQLAVFFDFEKDAYEKAGCHVQRVLHPFAEVKSTGTCTSESSRTILLLPGSRKHQALRNLEIYLEALTCLKSAQNYHYVVMASRQSLVEPFEKYVRSFSKCQTFPNVVVETVPQSAVARSEFFGQTEFAISVPGTVTLELALSGCPFIACMRPDFLTKAIAGRVVKTSFFALPNIILKRMVYPEFIVLNRRREGAKKLSLMLEQTLNQENALSQQSCIAEELQRKLQVEKRLESLMFEFLAQLV
ncbi:MAG: lipid-A-disaccharide synthase [Fibrobacter sp.]|nr:lipid-A-disaccharide synthase [Fibrobacter sp.]